MMGRRDGIKEEDEMSMTKIVAKFPNGHTRVYRSIMYAYSALGVTRAGIERALKNGTPLKDGTRVEVCKDILTKKKVVEPEPEEVVAWFPDGSKSVYGSYLACAKALGVDTEVIRQKVNNGQEWHGVTFDLW